MEQFTVSKVENGFKLSFTKTEKVGEGEDTYVKYKDVEYVFTKASQLNKAVKAAIADLRQEDLPF